MIDAQAEYKRAVERSLIALNRDMNEARTVYNASVEQARKRDIQRVAHAQFTLDVTNAMNTQKDPIAYQIAFRAAWRKYQEATGVPPFMIALSD